LGKRKHKINAALIPVIFHLEGNNLTSVRLYLLINDFGPTLVFMCFPFAWWISRERKSLCGI